MLLEVVLQHGRDRDREKVGDEAEAARLHQQYNIELNRQDKKGRRLGDYGVTRIYDQSLIEEAEYEGFLRDADSIIAGLGCGAAASIWSVWVQS